MSSKTHFDFAVRYLATTKRISFEKLWKLSKEIAEQRKQEREHKREHKKDCETCNGEG